MKKKTNAKKIIGGVALVLVVALLAALPMITASKDSGSNAEIRSASAEQREMAVKLVGGGQLQSEGEFSLKIPEKVKLTRFLVGNGDAVAAGDPVAVIDPVSVMTAITEVQQSLTDLSGEISKAASNSATETLSSVSAARVKKIYAQPGDAVQDVMQQYGCLAVLSLDDTMSVTLATELRLSPGDKVNVSFAGGSTVTGRVRSSAGGEMVVTLADKNYEIGTEVTVTTADGEVIGFAGLQVFNAWNLIATEGTVNRVLVKEQASIPANRGILTLNTVEHSAEYQRLIDKRQKYEALMQELFQMYRSRVITAPCDGIVSGVDTEGSFMLTAARPTEGFYVMLLSSSEPTPGTDSVGIVNAAMSPGKVGETYSAVLTAGITSDPGTALSGTWAVENLPAGLELNSASGEISGVPTASGAFTLKITFTTLIDGENVTAAKELGLTILEPDAPEPQYTGILAKVEVAGGNIIAVKQSDTTYPISDLDKLPQAKPDESTMTTEAQYEGELIVKAGLKAGDVVWIITDEEGNLVKVQKYSAGTGGGNSGGGRGGFSFGGFGSKQQPEEDPYYTLEKLTVATVTSQEDMSVTITLDELDITKIYVGQTATITMNALAEEPTEAVVSEISNSGENSGGNSKFTVKLKLSRSSNMLPGMNCTATFVLSSETVLTIPVEALVEKNGSTLAYTGYDEEKETFLNPVEVTIGTADEDYVQILSGLQPGATVYYEHYEPEDAALPSGMPIGAPGRTST